MLAADFCDQHPKQPAKNRQLIELRNSSTDFGPLTPYTVISAADGSPFYKEKQNETS